MRVVAMRRGRGGDDDGTGMTHADEVLSYEAQGEAGLRRLLRASDLVVLALPRTQARCPPPPAVARSARHPSTPDHTQSLGCLFTTCLKHAMHEPNPTTVAAG